MLENGFAKFDRKILTWRWYKNENTFKVFFHLIMTANIIPCDFENITIMRGERATSYKSLSVETGLTERQIRTAVNHLKTTGELTSKSYPKFSVFTLIKYNDYQSSAEKLTGKRRTTDERPTNDRQQYKKDKKDKNEKEYYSERFEKFFSSFPKKSDKQTASKIFEEKQLNDVQLDYMLKVLEEDKQSKEWLNENGRYIPKAAKWLEEERYKRALKSAANNYGSGYRRLTADD